MMWLHNLSVSHLTRFICYPLFLYFKNSSVTVGIDIVALWWSTVVVYVFVLRKTLSPWNCVSCGPLHMPSQSYAMVELLVVVDVVMTACPSGFFGLNCEMVCNCQSTLERCHPVTGDCASRCRPGYAGPGCRLRKHVALTINFTVLGFA